MNQWIGVQIIRIDRDPSDRRKERKFREDVLFVEEEEEGQKKGGGVKEKRRSGMERGMLAHDIPRLCNILNASKGFVFFSRKLNSCRYFNIVHER